MEAHATSPEPHSEQSRRAHTRLAETDPGSSLPLTITMSDLYRNAMLNKLPQLPTTAPWANDEDAEDAEEDETDSLGALPSSSMPPPRSCVPSPSSLIGGT